MNPEQTVLLFGARSLHVHFDGQVYLPLEGSVINLEGEQLDRAPFFMRRLRHFAHPADHDAPRLDREIDLRLFDAREIDTNSHRCFASKRVDRRLPSGGDGPRELHACQLVGHIAERAVQPAQLDIPDRIHGFGRSQIPYDAFVSRHVINALVSDVEPSRAKRYIDVPFSPLRGDNPSLSKAEDTGKLVLP